LKEASVRSVTFGITFLMLCSGLDVQCSARTVKENQVAVTAEARKAVFRRAVEIWQQGNAQLIDAVVTPNYVGHTSKGIRNIDGLRARVTEFHALYPDIKFTIEDQFAEGDRIATRMTAYGTSKENGKSVHLIGLNISRFVGNRIAEEWPVWEIVR
jgi:predicted ester cyclase